MKRLTLISAAAALTLALAACSDSTDSKADDDAAKQAVEASTPTPSPTPTSTPSELTIVSGGDILTHLSVLEAGRLGPDEFDFTPYWSELEDYIAGADLALCSLEIPILAEGETPSNYPLFGAPRHLATAIAEVGYDGCATATNHTLDRRYAGMSMTIEELSKNGLGWAGSARTQEEADEIQFYTLESGGRDVKIAHISATTLTNGIPIPADHPYSWNVVGMLGDPVSTIVDDAKKARQLGADLVVVSMHWGTEYVNDPIKEQTDIAEQLALSGEVDLVFGNHSHVPEPIAELDGGPRGEGMWVVWSMGNQLSGQTVENHGYRVTTGLLTTATISVPAEGPATVKSLEWMAVTQDRPAGEKMYPLFEILNGTAKGYTMSQAVAQARADVTYPVMSESGPERQVAPKPVATKLTVSREGTVG